VGGLEARDVSRADSDEHYLLDICDRVLERKALRQHRFPFLVGDPGRNGRCARLPVDAWYPDLHLVVEVTEIQHSEAVPLFDRRQTVSGVSRGEQRRIYDAQRAQVLPQHGIHLVVLDIKAFPKRARKLARDAGADEAVARAALSKFLLEGVSP